MSALQHVDATQNLQESCKYVVFTYAELLQVTQNTNGDGLSNWIAILHPVNASWVCSQIDLYPIKPKTRALDCVSLLTRLRNISVVLVYLTFSPTYIKLEILWFAGTAHCGLTQSDYFYLSRKFDLKLCCKMNDTMSVRKSAIWCNNLHMHWAHAAYTNVTGEGVP